MTGLHFIEQQKQIVLVAKPTQPDQIFRLGHGDSAFALHRFNQNGGRRFRDRAPRRLQIVERYVFEARDRRIESLFYFFLPGRCDPGQGSTVKRFERGDDFVAAFLLPELPCQFEQPFVCFRAAIAEKDAPGGD